MKNPRQRAASTARVLPVSGHGDTFRRVGERGACNATLQRSVSRSRSRRRAAQSRWKTACVSTKLGSMRAGGGRGPRAHGAATVLVPQSSICSRSTSARRRQQQTPGLVGRGSLVAMNVPARPSGTELYSRGGSAKQAVRTRSEGSWAMDPPHFLSFFFGASNPRRWSAPASGGPSGAVSWGRIQRGAGAAHHSGRAVPMLQLMLSFFGVLHVLGRCEGLAWAAPRGARHRGPPGGPIFTSGILQSGGLPRTLSL